MNGLSRSTWLSLTSVLLWLGASASAGWLGIWPAIGGTAIVLGLTILLFDRAAATALLRPDFRLVVVGAVAGGAMAAATYVLHPLLTRLCPFIATDTARLYSAFRVPSPAMASLALVPIVVGEELVWRGVVQATLVRRFGAWVGVALAAIAYALVQAPLGSPVLVGVALLCGLAWGALRAATGSLVPSLVAHLLWDVLVLLWLPLEPR